MKTPHVHAELIKAYADDPTIELQLLRKDNSWTTLSHTKEICPTFVASSKYRIKPERVFPKSTLVSPVAVFNEYFRAGEIAGRTNLGVLNREAHQAVADAAVKQYILEEEAERDSIMDKT